MRAKRGFTLYELLISLAIIALLSAIAIPLLVSANASANRRRLDSEAEELFLYSENRIVRLRELGSLSELEASLKHKAGAPDGQDYALSGDDSGLLPLELISEAGGRSALAVADTLCGGVLAVYYSEELSAEELEAVYLSSEVDDPKALERLHIGCFRASEPQTLLPFRGCAPRIEVMNREDLWLEITFEDIPRPSPEGYEVKLRFSGPLGSVETSAEYIFADGGELKAYCLIDRMTEGGGSVYAERFAPLLGSEGRITASAALYLDGRLLTSKSSSRLNEAEFSPLFEDDSGGVIKISRLRHLSNLRQLSGSADVLQTADIGFGEDFRRPEDFYPFSPMSGSAHIEPIPEFYGSFDGADCFIFDPAIEGGGASGLFAVADAEFKNVHISATTGGNPYVRTGEGGFAAGALCGIAGENSRLFNCSASGVTIDCKSEAEEIYAGGLVGILKGSAARCSASVSISAAGERVFAGGLVGRLDGGVIENSHSSGRIEALTAGGSAVGGIAAKGSGGVKNCYSLCAAGFIGSAEFYGICPGEIGAAGSRFSLENGWLDRSSDGAMTLEEISNTDFAGFSGSAIFGDKTVFLPESVSINGAPTRLDSGEAVSPRGLLGVVKVKYDGGKFAGNPLCCFDACENDRDFSPIPEWNSPKSGETRFYLFRSAYSSDEWSFEPNSDGIILGEEFRSGRFLCREILGIKGGEIFTLRFASAVRTVVAEKEQTTATAGAIAVLHSLGSSFDPWGGWGWGEPEPEESYTYYYAYFAPDSAEIKTSSIRVPQFEELTYPSDTDGEVRIYAFSDRPLGDGWDFEPYYDGLPYEVTEIDGIYYYELFGGSLSEFGVRINCGDRTSKITFTAGYDFVLGTFVRVLAEP